MKKIKFGNIPILIGFINWIIVVIIFIFLLTMSLYNSKVTPKELYVVLELMMYYLKYSFIPALISLVLTIKVNKGFKISNIGINLVFLILYSLVLTFFRNID